MKLLKKIFKILLLLALLTAFFLLGYYFSVTKGIDLEQERLTVNENTAQIFDANGNAVANASTLIAQEITPLEDIPKHTQFAFIDTEDRRFFTHGGFDLKRIAKALAINLKTLSFKEGASTISQQLIKNTHLSQQKTVKRKLQEFKLTYQLERNYSKEEILEKYLNTIYFGHSCFGITSAARFYFDKEPNELTVSESAILAGLVKSPNNYSPFKHPDRCKNRRDTVLNGMYAMKHLSQEEVDSAKIEPLPTEPASQSNNKCYFSAVFDELERLAEVHGFSVGGEICIHTYLNPSLQEFLEKQTKNLDCDCVFSVLDNGERGFAAYYKTAKINVRSPASIIKPLAVYAPAMQENLLSPATLLLDEKISFSGYEPKNFDGKYHGYVSVREAISKSLNIPAVKTLNALSVDKAASYLEKMHLSITEEDKSLALALGGMKNGFSLNEIVGAYSTFASNGNYAEPSFIKSISIDDRLVYSRENTEEKVFSEATSYLITDILRTTAKNGTAKKLRTLDFDIAAKTGTNGIDGKILDAYALSYTPKNVVGVWLGNASNAPIEYTGGGKPCDLLYEINRFLSNQLNANGTPLPTFQQPDTVKAVWLDKVEYENTKKLSLADEKSPAEYRFQEIFATNNIPSQTATHFSHPSIPTPSIEAIDGSITITFDINTPDFYTILVKKHYYATHNSYVTHSTLYDGVVKNKIFDKIERGKTYIYSVTPYFKETQGETVFLPAVSHSSGNDSPILPDIPPDIVKKDWWTY